MTLCVYFTNPLQTWWDKNPLQICNFYCGEKKKEKKKPPREFWAPPPPPPPPQKKKKKRRKKKEEENKKKRKEGKRIKKSYASVALKSDPGHKKWYEWEKCKTDCNHPNWGRESNHRVLETPYLQGTCLLCSTRRKGGGGGGGG